jgi:hypothetical protein
VPGALTKCQQDLPRRKRKIACQRTQGQEARQKEQSGTSARPTPPQNASGHGTFLLPPKEPCLHHGAAAGALPLTGATSMSAPRSCAHRAWRRCRSASSRSAWARVCFSPCPGVWAGRSGSSVLADAMPVCLDTTQAATQSRCKAIGSLSPMGELSRLESVLQTGA